MDLLRHLRCFVAVAEELHFGRAALRLHMAQPPLSQRIRALEQALGARLLDRTSRRVALTPAGAELLPEARALLARADALPDLVATATDGAAVAPVRAAIPHDLPAEVIAALVRTFTASGAEARLELVPGGPPQVRAGFGAGELQAAVVRRFDDVPGAAVTATLTARLGVVLAADDPLAAQVDVAPPELGDRTLVRATSDAELVAGLAAYGWEPPRTADAPDVAWARALVLAGGAVVLGERPPTTAEGTTWRPLAAPLVCRCSVLVADHAVRATAALVDAALAALVQPGGWSLPAPRRSAPPEGPLA